MNRSTIAAAACLLLSWAPAVAGVVVGSRLPDVQIQNRGLMVPRTHVAGGRMVLDAKDMTYRPWSLKESNGCVRTIYHLAARIGIDEVNKPYIDAIIAAALPEKLPDGAYKTVTILNFSDALWGTHGLGSSRLEGSQRETPWAIFVADELGVASKAWGLQLKQSAVIVLDKDGTVLFFKEGALSQEEIQKTVRLIQEHLKH